MPKFEHTFGRPPLGDREFRGRFPDLSFRCNVYNIVQSFLVGSSCLLLCIDQLWAPHMVLFLQKEIWTRVMNAIAHGCLSPNQSAHVPQYCMILGHGLGLPTWCSAHRPMIYNTTPSWWTSMDIGLQVDVPRPVWILVKIHNGTCLVMSCHNIE